MPEHPDSGRSASQRSGTARTCAYCGKPIHEEDEWWVDEDDNLVCENAAGELGPHAPKQVEES